MTCDMSQQVINSLLHCLHIHGQHDNITPKLLTTLVQAYSVLRPCHEEITRVMLQVPGVTADNLKVSEKNSSGHNVHASMFNDCLCTVEI